MKKKVRDRGFLTGSGVSIARGKVDKATGHVKRKKTKSRKR